MRLDIALLAAAGSLLAPLAAMGAEATLPVTKVTVFSSGVAYFEHQGRVNDDADVLLRFKTEGINDLLKSLVVMDQGGGTVSSVNYAPREPLDRALKSFGVDLSGQPTLADILRQLRGTEVIIEAPDRIQGKILGVQTRKTLVLPNQVIEEQVLDLVTPQGLKAVPLDTIRSIQLVDEKLNTELNQALGLLVESRDTDTKPVTIRFHGQGERPVRIGYISEAPIWKTSYRLVLDAAKKNEALLQGWAVVENTSDSDWTNVDLTLVSGRPISFIQDLYTPLYLPRPVVQPELYASLRPQQYAEGLQADRDVAELRQRRAGVEAAGKAVPGAGGGYGGGMGGMAGPAAAMPSAPPMPAGAPMMPQVQAAATGEAVGEVFTYHIKEPVTMPRRRSAMLPIINQPVAARKVSIYNQGVLAKHPLNGVWLTNNSGMTLLSGPVTVFDGGTYAGDAEVGNLSPDEKRLLSYAVDLKVTVDPSLKTTQRLIDGKIVRGVLTLSRRTEFTQTYLIHNKADQERTIVIEQPFSPERKLIEPAQPAEKTPTLYRFEVPVAANQTGKFEVREQQTDLETIEILPADIGALQIYARGGEIPQKTRDALAEVIRRKSALAQAQQTVANTQQRITDLRRDQADTRESMKVLDRNSQAYQRFEKKLLDTQTQIEDLQKQLDDQRNAAEKLRKDLEDYLANLNVG